MYIGRYTDRLLEENRKLKKQIEMYESESALAQMKELCDNRVRGAAAREQRNYDCWMKALEANKELKKRNTALWKAKEEYLFELKGLRSRNKKLEQTNEYRLKRIQEIEEKNDEKNKRIRELNETVHDKERQIAALKEELCRLKDQMDHDGTTNGIPTSKTPENKKKVIPNTREKTGRRKGGQPGHMKKSMEAFQDEEITETEDHVLDKCPHCGGELEKLEEDVIKDEADYEVRIIKKRHRFPKYKCKYCGKIVRASIPKHLKEKNQYGPSVQAMILALVDEGIVSIGRAKEMVSGILQNKLSPSEGYVGKMQKRAARLLKDFQEEARLFCLIQRILCWDDTVIFMNTSRACFRFYGNEKVAYYTAHKTKGAEGIEEDGVLANLSEKTYLMHDHVKYNYRKEFLFKNIECIQHMERELEKVYRASGHEWASEVKKLIQEMIHKRKEHLKKGIGSFSTNETNSFEEKLENLMARAYREYNSENSRYFSTDEMNAIKKLKEYRWNYFAWVYDFTLPTTNNISESALRMTKTKQKVSGQFWKEETASEFAAVRTYTETCRKNGIDVYEALKRLMSGNPYTIDEIMTGSRTD